MVSLFSQTSEVWVMKESGGKIWKARILNPDSDIGTRIDLQRYLKKKVLREGLHAQMN